MPPRETSVDAAVKSGIDAAVKSGADVEVAADVADLADPEAVAVAAVATDRGTQDDLDAVGNLDAMGNLEAAAGLEAAWREIEPPVVRRLMIAAVQEFASRGYHGTTTRDIAGRAGLSPAGVYVHFRSKEEVLYRISLIGHQHALAAIRSAAQRTEDPVARLRSVVGEFGAWHATHHIPARVINYEMGALSDEHLAEIMTLRREIDAVVRDAVEYGIEHAALASTDVGGAALALLSLTIDVARWYRPEGPRTPEQIGTLYADLAERMLRP